MHSRNCVAASRRRSPAVLHTRVVTGTGGGPDKTILNSARFLEPAGYRVHCAYMHPPGDPGINELQRKAETWATKLHAIEDRGPWDWKVISQLLKLCRRENIAIWHGHDYKTNALGVLLRRFWPMHLVTTVHGWVRHTARTPFYYYIDRRCLRYYDKVLCVSPDLQQVVNTGGVPSKRCVLIENAIDTADFQRRRSSLETKRDLGISRGRSIIGAVGRLSPEKGFGLLIHATKKLLDHGHDLELMIVGDGDERPVLEKLIAELGLGQRVRLLGYRSDTKELYECMDVFALSSLREGLPNVLLEAMALEVPLVSTRIAGVPMLITEGDNGLLAEPGSVDDLAEKLDRLLGDASLRQRFAECGRRRIEQHYSFEVRMNKIRQIYDEVLGRASVSRAD